MQGVLFFFLLLAASFVALKRREIPDWVSAVSYTHLYNDFNSDLTNLYACVKNHTMEFLRQLGFLPLNGRDEFLVLRRFLEGQEFAGTFLAQELELAMHNLPPLEFEELRSLLLERAAPGDVQRAAAFYKVIRYSYGSGCTSFGCQPFDVRKTFHLIWQEMCIRDSSDTVEPQLCLLK